MRTFFDIVAPLYEIFHFGAEKSAGRLFALTEFKATDVVVDIGGGTGRIAKFFVGRVKSITVIDPSEGMIEKCRKHKDITCVKGLAERLPLSDETVDKIIIVDAFHHFRDQILAASEMKRVLIPGGRIAVEEFNPKILFGQSIALFEKILHMGSRFHAPESLEKLFTTAGFEVELFSQSKSVYYLLAKK